MLTYFIQNAVQKMYDGFHKNEILKLYATRVHAEKSDKWKLCNIKLYSPADINWFINYLVSDRIQQNL